MIRVSTSSSPVLNFLRPLNRLLATATVELGHPIWIYPELNMFKIKKGKRVQYIHDLQVPLNTQAEVDLTNNKLITNSILLENGFPAPQSIKVLQTDSSVEREKKFAIAQMPAVVKPAKNSLKGKGVVTNIVTISALRTYANQTLQKEKSILIEPYYAGWKDYRVLVLDGRVLGVLLRIPAFVVGDGVSTIRKLIQQKNRERKKNERVKCAPISIDNELKNNLINQQIHLETIPKNKQYIRLKNVCNLGAGGELQDVTSIIHPENKKLAIRATKTVGLRFAGLDILCKDIRKTVTKKTGVILELNEEPDIAMHAFEHPAAATVIAKEIMKAILLGM